MAEDGGGEAIQHSSGGLKARSSPLSAHVRRRRIEKGNYNLVKVIIPIEKRPDIVKAIPRPPRYTPLSRSRRPRDQRRKWKHCVTSSLATVRRTAEGGSLCEISM